MEQLTVSGELKQQAPEQDRTVKVAVAGNGKIVMAKVPQGFETNINVRLVPGRDLDIQLKPKNCQPRQGAPRRDAEPLSLPPDLVVKLKEYDKAVIAWLAKDTANAKLFMHNPAAALVDAGVELTRSEQKAIARAHTEVEQTAVVGPGVRVAEFNAAGFTRGQIGRIKPGAKPKEKPDDNVGCAKEE